MNYYYENLAIEEAVPARIYIRKSSSDDCHYPLHWHRDLEFDLVLEMTGQTFHSYLTNIRLYHAYRKLQEQDTTITQIALENGFANVKSFIEAFKKVYRVTPDRYRQQ